MARRMDVAQDRISAYERAQDEPPAAFARKLAEVLNMPQVQVWRCLGLALPAELSSDEAIIEWAWRRYPRIMSQVPGPDGQPPPGKPPRRAVNGSDVTQSGDSVTDDSPGKESAV